MTHWKKLTNPDYLGAYAFEPNERKTVTIKTVKREMVTGTDGKKEECTVTHFVEAVKPLILNVTNAKAIEKLYSTPYIEEWSGKKIQLSVKKVKAFGDVVDAVRVDNVKPATVIIKCADCGTNIAAFGTMTAEQVANGAVKKYGVPICVECGKKRKEAAQNETELNKAEPDSSAQEETNENHEN